MFNLSFPFAHGLELGTAQFRSAPEDFCVDEYLGFEPSGEGEHFYVHLKKINTNTEWLAKQIAEFCGVEKNDVGFCGLKDRHAITTQWFSVYAPKQKHYDWTAFIARQNGAVELLGHSKHNKKLKRGQHEANGFRIALRNFVTNTELLSTRLQAIESRGVPNYFGEQRFGSNGNNLHAAQSWLEKGVRLKGAQKKFAMSAARSYLFNLVLAARVEANNWAVPIDGDVLFNDLPTAPLWGRGRSNTAGAALALENAALAPFTSWMDGLEHCGLNQERRALVLHPINFSHSCSDNTLCLNFALPAGEFATAVLREIALLENCGI